MVSRVSPHSSWVAMGTNSVSGIVRSRSMLRARPESTIRQSGVPSADMFSVPIRKRATSSMDRWVAANPRRGIEFSASSHKLSTEMDTWEPRLSLATASISSRMRVLASWRAGRPLRAVRRIYKGSEEFFLDSRMKSFVATPGHPKSGNLHRDRYLYQEVARWREATNLSLDW